MSLSFCISALDFWFWWERLLALSCDSLSIAWMGGLRWLAWESERKEGRKEGKEVLLLSCFSVKVCISYDTMSQVKLCKVNVPGPPRPSEPLHDLFHAVQKVPRG